MATRTIDVEKDRLTTILIAPLRTCSARLPVYTIIIGASVFSYFVTLARVPEAPAGQALSYNPADGSVRWVSVAPR
jgi:hypothetical protein